MCKSKGAYLGSIGVERRLRIVDLYGFGVKLKRIIPGLVAEGVVALVLELGRFFWRATHDGCGVVGPTGLRRHDGRVAALEAVATTTVSLAIAVT